MPSTATQFAVGKPTTAQRNSHRLRQGHVLRQLIDARDNLYQRLMTEQLTGQQAAQIARAFKELVQQIMDVQGQGKPRPVTARNDPDAKPRKAKPISEATPLSK